MAWEAVTAGTVAQAEVAPVMEDAGGEATRTGPLLAPSRGIIDAGGADGAARRDPGALGAGPAADERRATWLVEAIGNPLTYDAAATNRKDVCARVDPALYRRLQAMKEHFGLRTTAGAWESVLRAGLAMAERGVGQ